MFKHKKQALATNDLNILSDKEDKDLINDTSSFHSIDTETISEISPELSFFDLVITKHNNYYPCPLNDFLYSIIKRSKTKFSLKNVNSYCLSWNGRNCTDLMTFQFELITNKQTKRQSDKNIKNNLSISKIFENIPSALIVFAQENVITIIITHNISFCKSDNYIFKYIHKYIAQNYLLPRLKKISNFKYLKSFSNYDNSISLSTKITNIAFLDFKEQTDNLYDKNNYKILSGFDNLKSTLEFSLGLYSKERLTLSYLQSLSKNFIFNFPIFENFKKINLELLEVFKKELELYLNNDDNNFSNLNYKELKSLINYYLFLIEDKDIVKSFINKMVKLSKENNDSFKLKVTQKTNKTVLNEPKKEILNVFDIQEQEQEESKAFLSNLDIISKNLFYINNNYLKMLFLNSLTENNIFFSLSKKNISHKFLEEEDDNTKYKEVLINTDNKIFFVNADTEFQNLKEGILTKIESPYFPKDIETVRNKYSHSIHNTSLCISRQYKHNDRKVIYNFEDIASNKELNNSPSTLFNFLNIEFVYEPYKDLNKALDIVIHNIIDKISRTNCEDVKEKQIRVFEFLDDNLPFLDIVLLGHFFKVDFLRLFNPKHSFYKLLALLIYDIGFVTEKSYGKYLKASDDYDALPIPIKIIYKNIYYNLRFVFLDTCKINGPSSYESLITNANLGKDILELKQIEKQGVDKAEMLLAFYNKRQEFDNYALNDLYITEILMNLYKNNKEWLIKILNINPIIVDQLLKQNLTMGSNTVNLVTIKVINEIFFKDFDIIELENI